MKKPKIAIVPTGTDATSNELVRQIFEDPMVLELCTPVIYSPGQAPKNADAADATILYPTTERPECPADATEVVLTEDKCILPLAGEPTAEDIVKLRDILNRDLNILSPRIAIVQKTEMQNPDLANSVTAEHGINTYGPYTVEQMKATDMASHFDGIVCVGPDTMVQRVITVLSPEATARFFAGREAVVTTAWQSVRIDEEEGLADVSALTHPVYLAIDIIHNRATYDEARQNPLQKLYRDKREDKERGEKPKVEKLNTENDEQ